MADPINDDLLDVHEEKDELDNDDSSYADLNENIDVQILDRADTGDVHEHIPEPDVHEDLASGQMSSSDAGNKCYSEILCTALDKIGANQWMRRMYYEWNVLMCIEEELRSLNENGVRQSPMDIRYTFGSSIEGTTTVDMELDVDHITIKPHYNVVEQRVEGTNAADQNTVVVVTDMFTPPGFVKLKVDVNGDYAPFKLQQASDGPCFVSNIRTDAYTQGFTKNYDPAGQKPVESEMHGPALLISNKSTGFVTSFDVVDAFRNESWLSFDHEFFKRTRHHGSPSQETLDIMKGQGCFLVPTGHHFCKEEHRILQWRISFSFQERHLMLNLNTTQYKCYMLLKLVKKYHRSPSMDLTSYHCKTSLLYTIENTDKKIWKEDNILKCFILCLKRIKKWSRKRICPSYFIPELNLFTGKIEEEKLNELTHSLTNIIRCPQNYLHKLSTTYFGKLVELYMKGSTDDENIEEKVNTELGERLEKLRIEAARSILRIRSIVLSKISCKCSRLDMAIERHYKWLNTIQHLQSESNMGIYQLNQVRWALPYVCRFLHSSLASHLALKAIGSLNTKTKTWHTLSVAYHFWKGLQSDAHSGKLKLATFLFYRGYLRLDSLKSNYSSTLKTPSICTCSILKEETTYYEDTTFQNMFKTSPIVTMKMSTFEYIEKYVSACTIFLPTESELTLYPLQFEMHRSFGSKLNKLDLFYQTVYEYTNESYNCATLDSKVYYELLMTYLSGRKETAKLNNCCTNDTFEHKETTLNVLGWLISTEKINEDSLMCYKRSWDHNIRMQDYMPNEGRSTDKNAAKWHMALLLYRVWFNNKIVK